MKSRTEILKEFYKKGMNGKKSSLVKEAARVAECSEKTVMTFIYNQNKKERVKTDIKTVHVRKVVGSFQSYQRRYAKSCKLYGRKYSNTDAAQMWRETDKSLKDQQTETEGKMKGSTFLSQKESKVGGLVGKIIQVNALTFYGRMTPCGRVLIHGSSILVPKIEKFLWDMDDYLVKVRRILKKIIKENAEPGLISTVLTDHRKIKKINVRRTNSIQLTPEEMNILSELLQTDIFDKLACQTLNRLVNKGKKISGDL